MKTKAQIAFSSLLIIALFGLAGCTRTLDKVAKWKATGNVDKLINALEDPQFEIRAASAEALGELKAEAAVQPLAALFSDAEESVVLNSVNALVAIGNGAASTNLVDALKLDLVDARVSAAAGLGTLKAHFALDALIETLDDTEISVGTAAATSLGILSDEKASQPLAAKLKSRSGEFRLACAQALGSTKGKAAVTGLVSVLGDSDAGVRSAATASLVSIGKPSANAVLKVLNSEKKTVRKNAVDVLKQIKAVPSAGNDFIWYQLAMVSTDSGTQLNMGVVKKLSAMGDDAVETLLEAAAHSEADIREHAFRSLETIGESCTAAAMKAATDYAGQDSLTWLKGRTAWKGYPSWRIDLWSAVTAINPHFDLDTAKAANMQSMGRNAFRVITTTDFKPTREYVPLLIGLLGDTTTPPPEQPSVDEFGMPVVKKAADRFRGEANQQMARDKLIAANNIAVFPLIAAIGDADTLAAGHAAEILSELDDKRAVEPLIKVVEKKVKGGGDLSTSPFYNALQKMDDPLAEPVLMKIQPNTDRAIRLFERQYSGIRVNFVDTLFSNDGTWQKAFRIGYIDDAGKIGSMDVVIAKDGSGNWVPTPALPGQLP